jgi:hypothetical protein|tara:strand:+ start:7214 stop:7390 length:177 start_codon:yes stop_codon:yes gene_type:complete
MSDNELDDRTAALLDTLSLMNIENERMRAALNEIREIANASEGVEFYAMLAERGLKRG